MRMIRPIIVIPEDVTKEHCQHIILDAGHISIESDLVDKKALAEVKSKASKQYSDDDFRKLESLMYDKFFVKLEAAQVRPCLPIRWDFQIEFACAEATAVFSFLWVKPWRVVWQPSMATQAQSYMSWSRSP